MEEIKSVSELEGLGNQISNLRLKLRRDPKFRLSMLVSSAANKRAYEELCQDNEQAYRALPQEVKVSAEVGGLLANLFTEDVKARDALEEKHASKKFGLVANYMAAVLVPSAETITSAITAFAKEHKKITEYGEELRQLLNKTDKTTQEVLGSYQLEKSADGSYTLKRGTWFVNEWLGVSDGRGPTPTHYGAALKDVGISRDLIPAYLKSLFDKYRDDPLQSPNIGRWQR